MLFTKAAMDRGDIEVVAANDLMPFDSLANLFKHDSTHGIWPEDVSFDGNVLHVGDHEIKTFAERDPAQIPWGDVGADIVVESTGVFTSRDGAAAHIEGGAKKVIISAPGKGVDATFVYKVNHEDYDPEAHEIVSNASCTTNCIIPMVKVIQDNFGIDSGYMTTVHAYTNDQSLLDAAHKDPRRARSAPNNIVPTSTGAARTAGVIYPELQGKVDGMSMRVPVADGSITDFVARISRTRPRASSTRSSPCPTAVPSRCSAGTTTSGATRTGRATWQHTWETSSRSLSAWRLRRLSASQPGHLALESWLAEMLPTKEAP
ncbi:MAG: glyceraldehyde-3-phosphate dehydrogenase [Rubrobacteraceae bacterium]|nr:glyceraldehyde-3-phosphate dehydrogenase [Rubrobacteraceae bacterium]